MKKIFLFLISFLIFLYIFSILANGLTKNNKIIKKKYSVELSPCGIVNFSKPPECIITLDDNYNDMLITLNQQHKLIATGYKNNFYWGFYKSIGITPNINKEKILYLGGDGQILFDQQLFYSLKQLHKNKTFILHIDPYQLNRRKGWNNEIVKNISKDVGPFFANRFSRQNKFNGDQKYQFYTIFELSKKVGEVYQKRDVIQKLEQLTNKTIKNIQQKLPPKQKRPKVALIICNNKGSYTLFNLKSDGFGQAQYKAVGAIDAFENLNYSSYNGILLNNSNAVNLTLDLQGLIKVNPDIILVQFGIYSLQNSKHHTIPSFQQLNDLKNTQLGLKINAIKNNKIYPGGTPLQGPLMYLFQIQMAAKQIYPQIFGEWKPNCNYLKQQQLFDRDELKRILNR